MRATATANPHCPLDAVHAAGNCPAFLRHRDCPRTDLDAGLDRPEFRAGALSNATLPWTAVAPLLPDLTVLELSALLTRSDLTHPAATGILERITDAAATTAHPNGCQPGTPTATWARHPNADPGWVHAISEASLTQNRLHHAWVAAAAEPWTANSQVPSAVVANPAAPASALALIAARQTTAGLHALSHPNCPATALAAALDTTAEAPLRFGLVRQIPSAVAANPAAPREILSQIAAEHLTARGPLAFTYAHDSSGRYAHAVVALLDGWAHPLNDLLDAATDLLTATPAA